MEAPRDSEGTPIVRGSRVVERGTGKKGSVAATTQGFAGPDDDLVFVVFDGEPQESYVQPSDLTVTG